MAVRRCWLCLFVLVAVGAGVRADDWPQWLGPQRDGVWRETGLLDQFPAKPTFRWRAPVGEGYSGPAVAEGKVFVADRVLPPGVKNPANPFDKKSRVAGQERILCLDAATGKELWKHAYERSYQISYAAGPRATPVVAGGKVYALGAMGDLLCLDAADGKVLWSKYFPDDYGAEPPVWGFAASPLLDGDRLICLVGGKKGIAVAFHKDTGKELWTAIAAKEIGYAPPVIYDIDGTRQLVVWHPEAIDALDPATGKVFWSHRYGTRRSIKANLSIAMPRLQDHLLFFTAFYDGPLLLRVQGTQKPQVVWQGKGRSEQPDETDGLHSIMATPFLVGEHIYGVGSYGELRCLKRDTGERLWSTHAATGGKSLRWANAFLVEIGAGSHRFVLFNEQGDLILANLTPKGYDEIGRAHILDPTNTMAGPAGRKVIWSHPAYAQRCVFARNDREIVCVSMAASK